MKGVPRFLLVIVVLMAIVSTVVWFSRNRVREEEKKKEGAEMVTRAERRDIESTLLLTGEVKPANMQDVKAEVGGKVKSIEVVVGQFVRRGDPLIVIDDTDLLNEKATAQTAVDGAALRDLRLPPESLIAFVIRGGESIFPTGTTTLRAGDEILALTRPAYEEDLRTLFFARGGSTAAARPR